MNTVSPLETIAVAVVIERCKGVSPWSDFLWRPVSVLNGAPDTPPWTKLSDDGERATFYAGAVAIELYRSEAANYRDNLLTGTPLLWVALTPTSGELPYQLAGVTADPAEGEAWAGIGNAVVETVPMPDTVLETVAKFVSEHHVERTFSKRRRDRADPEAMARRVPARNGGKQ